MLGLGAAFKNPIRRSLLRHLATRSTTTVTVPLERGSEPSRRHKPGGYHPLRPGDVLNNRYKVVHQLGWGLYSTVWLVQDIKEKQMSALKVQISELTTYEGPQHELSKLQILRDTNPNSPGYRHICHLRDNFTIEGPHGAHVCLVLDPMRVSVFDIFRAFRIILPLDLLKRISKHVLTALKYVHDECGIIHTDIKGDNIMLVSMPPKSDKTTIEIGIDELMTLPFVLSDFGSAVKVEERSSGLIKPTDLRAPEVIVKAAWDTKADIWNFGCLIYEFAKGTRLFDSSWRIEDIEMTPPQIHLAQMVGVLGEFPRSLLERGERAKNYFDDEGHLLVGSGVHDNRLDKLVACSGHPLREIPTLVDFLRKALSIEPEERWSSAQLLQHPWLMDVDA
ncbi:hypothetical protein CVT26_009947 [Gymnopilus dilepis]|uniref:non-specific serine/threonine protein kinase n=1 Tax=Gymnopilus dilepis TaxID=231916 RepID=A0A409VL79_9AGAR|nr:hypothetical protein CVT26_009947 [Gymnopilus dilepis]